MMNLECSSMSPINTSMKIFILLWKVIFGFLRRYSSRSPFL